MAEGDFACCAVDVLLLVTSEPLKITVMIPDDICEIPNHYNGIQPEPLYDETLYDIVRSDRWPGQCKLHVPAPYRPYHFAQLLEEVHNVLGGESPTQRVQHTKPT